MIRVLGLALLFSGCASAAQQQARQVATDAKSQMVGLSREQVLACAGIPNAKEQIGQTEVWQYAGASMNVGVGVGAGNATGTTFGNTANVYGSSTSIGISRQHFCQVSIVLEHGHVAQVNYNGAGNLALCAMPLTNCVTGPVTQ